MKALTARQAQFVAEYLIDLNATQAAMRAGYSAHTARVTAAKLLAKGNVSAAVAEAMQARAERVQITQDEVLTELRTLLRSNVRHFTVDKTGELILSDGAPPDAWRAVSSVEHIISPGEHKIKYRLWDKPAAIRMAGQHLAMWRDVVDVHDKTLEQLIAEDAARGDDTPTP